MYGQFAIHYSGYGLCAMATIKNYTIGKVDSIADGTDRFWHLSWT
jgi:hypothetical protein